MQTIIVILNHVFYVITIFNHVYIVFIMFAEVSHNDITSLIRPDDVHDK